MDYIKTKLYNFLENSDSSLSHDDIDIKVNIFFKNVHLFTITNDKYIFSQLNNPFFIIPETNEIKSGDFKNYSNILDVLKLSKVPIIFNQYFMMLYLYSDSYLRAYSIGDWTIFSLSQVIDNFNSMHCMEPNIEWLCLGNKYMGLGHYCSLRMNIKNGKLFMQNDGGSNDWERIEYWETYKNQDLSLVDYIDYQIFIYLSGGTKWGSSESSILPSCILGFPQITDSLTPN